MKLVFILLIFSLAIFSCNSRTEVAAHTDIESTRQAVIKTDLEFSQYSLDSGYQKAFVQYADDDVIRLNPRRYATFGKKQLIGDFKKEMEENKDGSVATLTWKPLHVQVASSGDLASAFGDWQIITKLPNNKDTALYGNYITVWKKQADGKWKFILDGGNPTPGPTSTDLLNAIEKK